MRAHIHYSICLLGEKSQWNEDVQFFIRSPPIVFGFVSIHFSQSPSFVFFVLAGLQYRSSQKYEVLIVIWRWIDPNLHPVIPLSITYCPFFFSYSKITSCRVDPFPPIQTRYKSSIASTENPSMLSFSHIFPNSRRIFYIRILLRIVHSLSDGQHTDFHNKFMRK